MIQETLTPREREAAKLAAEGASNRHIAETMRVTEGTVKQYLHTAYEKLGIEKREQLSAKSGVSL